MTALKEMREMVAFHERARENYMAHEPAYQEHDKTATLLRTAADDLERMRDGVLEILSDTEQIWPQSLLDDMPALKRIQTKARAIRATTEASERTEP